MASSARRTDVRREVTPGDEQLRDRLKPAYVVTWGAAAITFFVYLFLYGDALRDRARPPGGDHA